jgi:hypothetical protein
MYSYMFRLTFSAIIRESSSIELRSVSLNGKMYIYYSPTKLQVVTGHVLETDIYIHVLYLIFYTTHWILSYFITKAEYVYILPFRDTLHAA